MIFRQSVIREGQSINTDGTQVFDITGDEPITRLTLIPKVTNGASYIALGHPDENISKIEIVDGSDVLISLSGVQARALMFYSSKNLPVTCINTMALQWSMQPLPLYFGRFLNDPEFALDPRKYNNLQIRVTTVIAAAMTGAAVGTLDIVADVMSPEYSEPKGLFISKELIELDTISLAVNYTDLPTDLPVRLLVGVCFSDSQAPEYNVSKFELYEGNRKNLIVDYDMEAYQQLVASVFPRWTDKISGQAVTGDRYCWVTPSFETLVTVIGMEENDAVITPEATGGQKKNINASATSLWEGIASGWAPHGSTPFFFPGIDTPDGYWHLEREGSGTLKTTFHTDVDTTPTYDVVSQQLQMY